MATMFQARHFEAIASEISDIAEGDLRVVTAIRFASLFAKDNPKFKHDKFMRACGLNRFEDDPDYDDDGNLKAGCCHG